MWIFPPLSSPALVVLLEQSSAPQKRKRKSGYVLCPYGWFKANRAMFNVHQPRTDKEPQCHLITPASVLTQKRAASEVRLKKKKRL